MVYNPDHDVVELSRNLADRERGFVRQSFPCKRHDEDKEGFVISERTDFIVKNVMDRVACVLRWNTTERNRFARVVQLMQHHERMTQFEAVVELYTRSFGVDASGPVLGHGTMH